MEKINIDTEFIKLDQLLKLATICQTGGHAKILIQDELVKVNGVIENRRGKKIKKGDIVEVENIKLEIV